MLNLALGLVVLRMLYIAIGLVVYAFTAVRLLRVEPPRTFREALGGALACALVAAVWPVALLWRGLLGGSGSRPEPEDQTARASEPSRSEA